MGLRRDVLCAMTGFLAISYGTAACATQVHVLQPGETIAAVARKYHVTVSDLVRANKLANANSVPDFTKLHIPPPVAHIVAQASMHRLAEAKGDSVSVRLGPNEARPRMTYIYAGTPVTVTAIHDGWDQITLQTGKQGWVRGDFLTVAKGEAPLHLAHNAHTAKLVHKKPVHLAVHQPLQHAKHIAAVSPKSRTHPVHGHSTRIVKVAQKHHPDIAVHTQHKSHIAHSVRHNGKAPITGGGGDIVRTAFAYRGTPYRYGGAGRGGFDCSGFTSYLYSRRGVSLPHSARGQFERGRSVSRGELAPGDLVFFHTVTPGISHVGMYVGNGKFVHASSRRSGGVRVDSLNSGYYRSAFRGARHIR